MVPGRHFLNEEESAVAQFEYPGGCVEFPPEITHVEHVHISIGVGATPPLYSEGDDSVVVPGRFSLETTEGVTPDTMVNVAAALCHFVCDQMGREEGLQAIHDAVMANMVDPTIGWDQEENIDPDFLVG